jgi:hypothetical protein
VSLHQFIFSDRGPSRPADEAEEKLGMFCIVNFANCVIEIMNFAFESCMVVCHENLLILI